MYKYIYPGWVTVQGVWASKHRPLYVGYAMSSNTTSQITIESEGLRLRTGMGCIRHCIVWKEHGRGEGIQGEGKHTPFGLSFHATISGKVIMTDMGSIYVLVF